MSTMMSTRAKISARIQELGLEDRFTRPFCDMNLFVCRYIAYNGIRVEISDVRGPCGYYTLSLNDVLFHDMDDVLTNLLDP